MYQAYSPTMYHRYSATMHHFPTRGKRINLLARIEIARRNHVRKKAEANGNTRNAATHPGRTE
jgi:hypothetical protein